jgi:Carboxypeptidase regulatory-like domain
MANIKRIISIYLIPLLLVFLLANCDKSTGPKETKGNITGKVMYNTTALPSAYIFIGDSLRATTDDSGAYSITSVDEGSYNLLCSALNYHDTTSQVQVSGGQTVTRDFYLIPDTTTGWIRGEFQDIILFNDSLVNHPSMANWDAQQVWQASTGATMIGKFLLYNVPRQKIFLGDNQISITDDWAQYALKIQCGTYQLTGTCVGYYDANEVITVLPGGLNDATYVNFFMMRISPPKLTARN